MSAPGLSLERLAPFTEIASAPSPWRGAAAVSGTNMVSRQFAEIFTPQARKLKMRPNLLVSVLLASAVCVPAFAQSNSPVAPSSPGAMSTTAPTAAGPQWRASKLVGVDVYNDQNEKLGDIGDVMLDGSGKVVGIVVEVGGFLGVGQRNVMVPLDKLKFVSEPRRTATTTTTRPTTTTGTADRPATTTTTTTPRTDEKKWYPDHAMFSGATKDSLKSMPEFKYN
jgi:sporulation protein YlmC with PRC-barrel domain